jgi:hypothetical protein
MFTASMTQNRMNGMLNLSLTTSGKECLGSGIKSKTGFTVRGDHSVTTSSLIHPLTEFHKYKLNKTQSKPSKTLAKTILLSCLNTITSITITKTAIVTSKSKPKKIDEIRYAVIICTFCYCKCDLTSCSKTLPDFVLMVFISEIDQSGWSRYDLDGEEE